MPLCPFCKSEVPYDAVVCSQCTRHMWNDFETNVGPVPSLNQQMLDAPSKIKSLGWMLMGRLLFVVPLALLIGIPLLPVIVGLAGLIGFWFVIFKLVNSGGNHNG